MSPLWFGVPLAFFAGEVWVLRRPAQARRWPKVVGVVVREVVRARPLALSDGAPSTSRMADRGMQAAQTSH